MCHLSNERKLENDFTCFCVLHNTSAVLSEAPASKTMFSNGSLHIETLLPFFSLKGGGSKGKGAPKSGQWGKMSRSESCLSSGHFCVVWGKAHWPLILKVSPSLALI